MAKSTKTPVAFRFDERKLKLLNELAEKHGGKQAAVDYLLESAAKAKEPTDAQLLAILKARLASR